MLVGGGVGGRERGVGRFRRWCVTRDEDKGSVLRGLGQGLQKTRKFEKARKSPGFFKKPGLFPGLFQIEYDRNSTSIVSIK